MSDFEKPGSFYIGKTFNPADGKPADEYTLYDSRDLTTHAVCVGMTGSGKTGLCVDILEEAALNDVPTIIIDPKGDITNLLLTFPELRPEDFQPWVNPGDARRKNLSVEEFAANTAQTWRDGLAQWGQGPERIRRLKDSAEFVIYTPGSDAGWPVSILQTLQAPTLSWDTEEEALRERIKGTVSALLGLIGIDADPLRSREHILLSSIFEHAWRQGQDLDLAQLIMQVQTPPVRKLGVFDVDTFFPEKDRFELAMSFNAILAAPSFQTWIEGIPLDVEGILRNGQGKPRASVFYIAHLSDQERMFFVSLLLEQVRTWMRGQSGTTSLRALIYFDEVFGYFPPHPANPPSKEPLLSLLKQARAFGVGVVLVTQNPVDLDYKGLTNAGTWFIGKLQTDRDKDRVLEGLEGAIQEAGTTLDRKTLDRTISALKSRVFLMHNVHEDAPTLFMTRWAMSYLRGPLTKTQVKTLMGEEGRPVEATAAPAVARGESATAPVPSAARSEDLTETMAFMRPSLPADVPQYFLPVSLSAERAFRAVEDRVGGSMALLNKQLVYEPVLLGAATVHCVHSKSGIETDERWVRLAEPPQRTGLIRWDESEVVEIDPRDLSAQAADEAKYAELPAGLSTAQDLKKFSKDFDEFLYRNATVSILYNEKLDLYSAVGESEGDFEKRCEDAADDAYEAEEEKLKAKYEAKIEKIEDKRKREERELAEDEADLAARKQDEVLSGIDSGLSTVLGLLGGGRLSTKVSRASSKLSKASTKRRMTGKAQADVEESKEAIAQFEEDIEGLQGELEDELTDLKEEWNEAVAGYETVDIQPRRGDVVVEIFGIGWRPVWEIGYDDGQGREVKTTVQAFGDS